MRTVSLPQVSVARLEVTNVMTMTMAQIQGLDQPITDRISALTNLKAKWTPLMTLIAAATEATDPGITAIQGEMEQNDAMLTQMLNALNAAKTGLAASLAFPL